MIEEASRGWLDGCGVIITVKEKGEKYHPVRVVGSHTEIQRTSSQHKDGHDQGKKVQSFQFATFFVRSPKLPNLYKFMVLTSKLEWHWLELNFCTVSV